MGIFTRIWPNFGFESHKIARYLVLNVSMAHSDAFKTMFNALKVSAVPSALSEGHAITLKTVANGYFPIFIEL